MDMEKARGVSMISAALQFSYARCVINLLDTRGRADFSEDTYRGDNVPTFRLESRDGQHNAVEAHRVDIANDRVASKRGTGWGAVETAQLTEVRTVERRMTEVGGRRQYLQDKAVAAALRPRGSDQ
jgi:hypothetical protein